MAKQITSAQNPFIKELLALSEKSKLRRAKKLFILEGMREISLALKGGYQLQTLIFSPEIADKNSVYDLLAKNTISDLVEVPADLYQKIAYRGTTEGVLAIAKSRDLDLKNLILDKQNPLILVAEAPEKPGNIGALLRTADAANLDAVIIANPKTDMYNPNIIRSSVGCLFTNKVATGTTDEIISFLQNNRIHIYCAALQASVQYDTIDFKDASAIVVGTEATGLSDHWLSASTRNIIIPMHGEIDSMNVSVAAGILIFEAKRQRKFQL